ncbi:FtsX-like permease family protein [uncultured Microbacterium sp.]|uniref:FtsX-like permease family protein n=1 Tax=uncultured Microbacterium sp. TaxID=191216 RepID=UPI00261BDC73|nr:FtsX-like permease family protein [uncultured Microbacterium sp.]
MNPAVLALLLKPERGQGGVLALPLTSFAVVTALLLSVIGGAQKFWTWSDLDAGLYQALASVALMLLLIPLATLGAAAARLSARRRDERLSTLRLLGVSPAGVVTATVVESTVVATAGAVVGVLGYLALTPLIGLIAFRGEPLGFEAVLLSTPVILLIVMAVVALAAVSAILGLRRIIISPLGVRSRTTTPRVHWIRAVIAVVVIGVAFTVLGALPGGIGFALTVIVIVGLFGASLGVLNLIGPWVLTVHARLGLRRADKPERLLSARLVLESPPAAWRQVSGVAMASFMAVFAGTGVALIDVSTDGPDGNANLLLATDIRTGLIITLIASFLMVAVSLGVNQSSALIDQHEMHRSLHRLGVPLATVDSARVRAVMAPILLVTIGSALCAAAMLFPLLGVALIIAPLSLLTIAAVLICGVALVWLSTRVTRPLLARAFAPA